MNACKRIIRCIIGGILVLAVSTAFADPACAQVIEEDWSLSVETYAWMTGVEGDLTIGSELADVNVDTDDIWDDMEIGGTLHMELEKNTYGLFAQPSYFKLTDEESLKLTNGEIETEVWVVEFGAFYRLAESKGDRVMTFDFLFGGRFWDLSNDIRTDTIRHDRKELIDPMVGFRLKAYLSERLFFNIKFDVGGFNIGGSTSEVSWQAQGIFGFDIGEKGTLFIGYRDLNINTDSGQNDVDLTFHGPLLGVGFTF